MDSKATAVPDPASKNSQTRGKERLKDIGVVLGILTGLFSIGFTVLNNQNVRANEARTARHQVVANVLQMGQYDAEAGTGRQNEITLLAADSEELITEFGQDRLHLSAALYRQVAQYVVQSTTDLELAERMADAALRVSPTALEEVLVHRVLGDIAAQRQDPAGVKYEYGQALRLSSRYREQEPYLGAQAETYTRAYRLLGAYLGASRSTDDDHTHAFCDLTMLWRSDLSIVQQWSGRPLIHRQLQRVGVEDANGLRTICG